MNIDIEPLSAEWLEQMGQDDPRINAVRLSGLPFVVLVGGEPLAAGGFVPVRGSEYAAWAIVTDRARDSALIMRRITRQVRVIFPIARQLLHAESIVADAINEPRFCRWLEVLGFRRKEIVHYEWVN